MARTTWKPAVVAALALLSACATTSGGAPAPGSSMKTPLEYPAAPREAVVDVIHGVPVADPTVSPDGDTSCRRSSCMLSFSNCWVQ